MPTTKHLPDAAPRLNREENPRADMPAFDHEVAAVMDGMAARIPQLDGWAHQRLPWGHPDEESP